ncbi:MAG: chemotaxis protein CheC [Gemmatimonadaceae bacterium]|nr:chemotaxis protein CheC [Gemmatimonadaceae bacterium]NUQ94593.1 chemotaxis protein CheC [Gemmatimonadaceae bacterium]NUR20423.1 chemotaxis protein CheC [Gemmatimonadaceae bacterium]NUS98672.1 chemotaxis protein CheC [Gemmatimonadaceae bacterium]
MTAQPMDTDALTELFNIGLHRAASSLSELTGQRILVDLPRLWVCPIKEMHDRLLGLLDGDLATVHQIFKGSVTGDAVLVLQYDSATRLAALMTQGNVALGGRLDQSAREVLAEVGNVILSACLSAFGDMLHVSVSFSVPRIHVESLEGLLSSLVVDNEDLHFALLAATRFRLTEGEVGGYLIIAVGMTSLSLITRALAAREG